MKLGSGDTGTLWRAEGGSVVQAWPMVYSQAVLADSPIAYWPLGDTEGTVASDLVGGRNMTYRNSPILGVDGPGGLTGVTFNGMDEAADTAYDAAFDRSTNTAWSFEGWINYTTSGTSIQTPLAWRGTTADVTDEVATLTVNNGVSGRIQVNCGNSSLFTRVVANSDGGWNDGNWHHIVGTSAPNGDMKLYVDGVLRATNPDARESNVSANRRVAVGANIASPSTFSQPFAGSISNVAIYGTTLSAEQVAAHYSAMVT